MFIERMSNKHFALGTNGKFYSEKTNVKFHATSPQMIIITQCQPQYDLNYSTVTCKSIHMA